MLKYLILLKIQNMMDIKVDLLQWSINFWIKKPPDIRNKNENISDQQLEEELRKPIIRKLKKRQYCIDNIWGADIVGMQLVIKLNKGVLFYYMLLIFLVSTYGLFL